MENYIYARTKTGIHYLDLAKTWEKLMVAARVVTAVQAKNTKDVLVSNSILQVLANALISYSRVDRLFPPLCSESRPQVRHLHRS